MLREVWAIRNHKPIQLNLRKGGFCKDACNWIWNQKTTSTVGCSSLGLSICTMQVLLMTFLLLSMSHPFSELSISCLPPNFSRLMGPSRHLCQVTFLFSYCPVLFKFPREISDWPSSILLAWFFKHKSQAAFKSKATSVHISWGTEQGEKHVVQNMAARAAGAVALAGLPAVGSNLCVIRTAPRSLPPLTNKNECHHPP